MTEQRLSATSAESSAGTDISGTQAAAQPSRILSFEEIVQATSLAVMRAIDARDADVAGYALPTPTRTISPTGTIKPQLPPRGPIIWGIVYLPPGTIGGASLPGAQGQ